MISLTRTTMKLHTRTCICGCGQEFQAKSKQALFLNREHAHEFNVAQRKGQPQRRTIQNRAGRRKAPAGWSGNGAVEVTSNWAPGQ